MIPVLRPNPTIIAAPTSEHALQSRPTDLTADRLQLPKPALPPPGYRQTIYIVEIGLALNAGNNAQRRALPRSNLVCTEITIAGIGTAQNCTIRLFWSTSSTSKTTPDPDDIGLFRPDANFQIDVQLIQPFKMPCMSPPSGIRRFVLMTANVAGAGSTIRGHLTLVPFEEIERAQKLPGE